MLPTLKLKIEKPKGTGRLPTLGRKVKLPPIPNMNDEVERRINLVGDELTRLAGKLGGDEQLAKRILKLKAKMYKHYQGTIPELIIMDWLDRKGYKYEFQMWLLGGRAMRGGQVVDFAVDVGNRVILLEPQTYWHTRPGAAQRDAGQRLALLGIEVWGKPTKLVEAWERRLFDKNLREAVLMAAMNGVELGK